MGAHNNRLIETVLLGTHNICFGFEIKKIVFHYALLSVGLLHLFFYSVHNLENKSLTVSDPRMTETLCKLGNPRIFMIHNMYANASARMKNLRSGYFSSNIAVRQGKILPSVFLNDLSDLISHANNGLNNVTDIVHILFSNDDIEVYFIEVINTPYFMRMIQSCL